MMTAASALSMSCELISVRVVHALVRSERASKVAQGIFKAILPDSSIGSEERVPRLGEGLGVT